MAGRAGALGATSRVGGGWVGGGGRHSAGLFLTYATRLTFFTVWLGTWKKKFKND